MAFHLDVGPFYLEDIKSSACDVGSSLGTTRNLK